MDDVVASRVQTGAIEARSEASESSVKLKSERGGRGEFGKSSKVSQKHGTSSYVHATEQLNLARRSRCSCSG